MDGIVAIWKETGMTSHDCVFKIRKILRMKKVGHTGTLDPEVDGVLPICLGRATKIAEYITDSGKSYRAQVSLGTSTTTEDAHGEIVDSKKITHDLSKDKLKEVLNQLTGKIQQTPPMYSAVKVNGKRLYEYARQGVEVERPTRVVDIHKITLDEDSILLDNGVITFTIDIDCGKGTYIRTLAVMIGELLGYPAHMSKLTRTKSALFTSGDCITLAQLEERALNPDAVREVLHPMETGLSQLKKYLISDTVEKRVKNGSVMPTPPDWSGKQNEPVVLYNRDRAVAIYHLHPSKEGLIKPIKVLWID
ncbi:tRNA pseudouridine(55) synthase TruB [Jeotgalibacillus campisalis]|uniref:tRNA pseudouridine synthase B n=1 Tax=Jeotgalibacillus campisalis TaxID=220754 RepID=A0A0C2VTK3_9BACL|nr:tRNA pseudouridine(55) synthase TruB [Jeotgalibacillus campisalis]KIL47761.1 tRNA pseudouridine synthase B [Jeotgalibacillus campisalis]